MNKEIISISTERMESLIFDDMIWMSLPVPRHVDDVKAILNRANELDDHVNLRFYQNDERMYCDQRFKCCTIDKVFVIDLEDYDIETDNKDGFIYVYKALPEKKNIILAKIKDCKLHYYDKLIDPEVLLEIINETCPDAKTSVETICEKLLMPKETFEHFIVSLVDEKL